ncbi:MAG TPA: YgiQ family radical SAM protein, partial [Atribacterota bacterium]|nr:YgiQ family radical SAM protein [Atribacterota bacterium]
IAQPALKSPDDIRRLGEPALFWGVTAGSLDSMIANYTATGKKRKRDDFTPGGINNRRPDRATIVYSNLIKQYFKDTRPVVLGGIEASLRRIAHYDFWDNRIRRSILLDSKGDYLIYGMAEKSVLQFAELLSTNSQKITEVRGICYISKTPVQGSIELPTFLEVQKDKKKFTEMFNLFYKNQNPFTAKTLSQKYDNRYLIHNPPSYPLSQKELDKIYELDYERDVHPYYGKLGRLRALDTIKFSVTSHRGCFGECNFCAITVHQGKCIQSRSQKSIIKEIKLLTRRKDFKGYILDVGGPTANMYDMECTKNRRGNYCAEKRCLFPSLCSNLSVSHKAQIELLKAIRKIKGIKKVFVASGIRYDLILADGKNGQHYLSEIIEHHLSGQLKVAPEHIEPEVLSLMGKGNQNQLGRFKKQFDNTNKKKGLKQYLTYYFMSAHPGCSEEDMTQLKNYIKKELKLKPEQVQVFIPAPSTYSALMYYTERNPFTGDKIFVEKKIKNKDKQKKIITA